MSSYTKRAMARCGWRASKAVSPIERTVRSKDSLVPAAERFTHVSRAVTILPAIARRPMRSQSPARQLRIGRAPADQAIDRDVVLHVSEPAVHAATWIVVEQVDLGAVRDNPAVAVVSPAPGGEHQSGVGVERREAAL